MTQKELSRMDKITSDSFVEVYAIGPIRSLNIRVDHSDKKSASILKKLIGIKFPSAQKAVETNSLILCWISTDEFLLLSEKKENEKKLIQFQEQMNGTSGIAENTTDLRSWFLIRGDRALDVLRKGVPLNFNRLNISENNFFRTRLGEIQINILFRSVNEVLISVLRSHNDYMVDWFGVCSRSGTEINFDL